MTLFKKVFDNHYAEGTAQFDDQHEDELDFDEIEDDMLFAQIEAEDIADDAEKDGVEDSAEEARVSETSEDTPGEDPSDALDDGMHADAPDGSDDEALQSDALPVLPAMRSRAPELPSEPASVAPVAPQSRAIKPEPAMPAQAAKTQPVEDTAEAMSLAERAAKAHALMQSQRPSGANAQKPSGTPLKLERRITPTPDHSDVVPIHRGAAPAALPEAEGDTPEPTTARKGGRVRTRLLGFHSGAQEEVDPMQAPAAERAALASIYPTGWLVVTDGPGEGRSFAIQDGVSTVGRGDDQTVILDFGDNSISRQSHAAIAYDSEQNKFFVGHGGKSNIIRLNNKPVLSTEELNSEDTIRIGETTLRFVALCGEAFKWERS
ncbi:MAG: FHA domain-containing protein [Pseudomonadota bacterium]